VHYAWSGRVYAAVTAPSPMIQPATSLDVVRKPYAGNVCAGGRKRNTESQWNGIARRCVCRSVEVRRGAPARRWPGVRPGPGLARAADPHPGRVDVRPARPAAPRPPAAPGPLC
jgi:hypothetical protein